MLVTFWLLPPLPPLTPPPSVPHRAPVEQMSSASSQISRLHTCRNTICVHSSAVQPSTCACVCARVCARYVIHVGKYGMCVSGCRSLLCKIHVCIHLNVRMCLCVCVCYRACVHSAGCGRSPEEKMLWLPDGVVHLCVCVRVCTFFFFFFFQEASWFVCACVCFCECV